MNKQTITARYSARENQGKPEIKWGMYIDLVDIKRVMKTYCEQLYAHEFNKLDEIDQFLERHNFLKAHTRRTR